LNGDLVERNADLDETLQKLREAQQELVRNERLAATGKLTAQLAHEINNPIHNIQSCLQTALKRLPADSRGRELIEVAYDEVGRMSRLTGQMLDIYRSSYSAIKFEDVQIGEVIQETISAMEADLSNAGIAARTTIPPGLPTVKGSKDKLKQVFLNLLLNARDAMPQGGTLKICVERSDGSVRVSVADTGVGIPKENLNRIFDAFFTTKDKVSGVGLGLSVVYGIVSQHDGTITVRSEPGRGATFVVTLPLQNQRSSSPT
jgi:two-component system NtrC family sensor kinase